MTVSDPSRSAPPEADRDAASAFRYVVAVVVVALAAAGFAIALRRLLTAVFWRGYLAHDIVSAFEGFSPAVRFFLPVVGGLLAGVVGLATARARGGRGVGDVMEAVVFGHVRLSLGRTLLQSLGSFFAIASGASIGREGPLIQFGGSIGATVGRALRLDGARIRTLIAAGACAGFAAAYNTPFAAVLFVLEVVTGMVALEAILPAVVAATIATALARALAGGGPIYGQRAFTLRSNSELLAHAVLGLFAGLASQLFMRLLSAAERSFHRSRVPQPWRAALGGALVGLIALRLPAVTGNGYEPLNALLDGAFALDMVVLLFVAKAAATTASVSSGLPGGVFTPTLLLGATLGCSFGSVLGQIFGADAVGPLGGYALVGMAAMTAATTHAPMMAAVLVFELSGDYAIVLPLMLATAVATIVSRQLRPDSIYAAELRQRGFAWHVTLEGRRMSLPPRDVDP